MTKEKFIRNMNLVVKANKTLDALDEIGCLNDNNILFDMIDALVTVCTEHYGGFVEYWCYEMDYGNASTTENGTTIYIPTPADLYDYIIENQLEDMKTDWADL